jgi:hypothetical protein
MNTNTRSQLEAIARDLDRWLLKHPSVFIGTISNRIQGIIKEELQPNGNISPCERVSYEKCLDRIDSEISRLKGQVSHDAWGPKYTADQSILMKDLKASRKQIVEKLGLPL